MAVRGKPGRYGNLRGDELYEVWLKDFDEIIQRVFALRKTYYLLQDLTDCDSGRVSSSLDRAHIHFLINRLIYIAIIEIRALCDGSKGVLSLRQLLKSIKTNADFITKEVWGSHIDSSNKEFEELWESTSNKKALVQALISRLPDTNDEVYSLASKTIAHFIEKKSPTPSEVEKRIGVIEAVAFEMYELFKGRPLMPLVRRKNVFAIDQI